MATIEKESEAGELAFTDAGPQEPDASVHEADALTRLEERIQKAVALVVRLRREKEAAVVELTAAQASLAAAQAALEDSRDGAARLTREINLLREEKLQVRNRLEKLLGHIDQLGTA